MGFIFHNVEITAFFSTIFVFNSIVNNFIIIIKASDNKYVFFVCSPEAESNSDNGLRLGDTAELFGREFYFKWRKGVVSYLNHILDI